MGKLCHGERDWRGERKKHGGRTLDIRKNCLLFIYILTNKYLSNE